MVLKLASGERMITVTAAFTAASGRSITSYNHASCTQGSTRSSGKEPAVAEIEMVPMMEETEETDLQEVLEELATGTATE